MKIIAICCVKFLFLMLMIIYTAKGQTQQVKLNWLAHAQSYFNGGNITLNDFAEEKDGSVILVGSFTLNADFDPGPDTFNLKAISNSDIFICKYSPSGTLVYAYSFGGSENSLNEAAYGITLDRYGNSYITGAFGKTIDFDPGIGQNILSAPKSNEIFIVSFTPDGKLRLAKNIADNQGTGFQQMGRAIAVDELLNIYITGVFGGGKTDFDPGEEEQIFAATSPSTIFFAKYDKWGNYIFNKVLPGYGRDMVNDLKIDYKYNILICGQMNSSSIDFNPSDDSALIINKGKSDAFIAKYDSAGNYLFAYSIGRDRDDECSSLDVADNGNYVIVGSFETNNVDFDPGPDKHLLSAISYDADGFFATYDENGNYIFSYSIGSYSTDKINDVVIDKAGNITLVGYLRSYNDASYVDFDPGPGNFYFTGTISAFIAKYSIYGDFIFARRIQSEVIKADHILVNEQGQISISGWHRGSLILKLPTTLLFLMTRKQLLIFMSPNLMKKEIILCRSQAITTRIIIMQKA